VKVTAVSVISWVKFPSCCNGTARLWAEFVTWRLYQIPFLTAVCTAIQEATASDSVSPRRNVVTRLATVTVFLDIVHRFVCKTFRRLDSIRNAGLLVRRRGLALSIGPNWCSTWWQRQNPFSETFCLLIWNRTKEGVQKHINCMNIPSPQTLQISYHLSFSVSGIIPFPSVKEVNFVRGLYVLWDVTKGECCH
jgi:hypothetical protein